MSESESAAERDQSTRRAREWLAGNRPEVRRAVNGAIAAGFAGGLLLIVQAGVVAHVANSVIFGGTPLARLKPYLLGLIAAVIARGLLTYAGERARFKAGSAVKLAVRDQLLEHLQSLGVIWQRGRQAGDLVNTVVDGVESLEAYYARYLPQMAIAAMIPLAIFAVVVPVDWISGLILLVTAPLIPVFMVLIGRGAERLNQRQWKRMGMLAGHFLDALQGLTTLKVFNLGRREARLIGKLSEEYRRSTMAVLRIAFISSLVLEFLATVSIAMVAVLIGFRLLWGDIGFQSGFLVLLLAPEFYLPLRTMGSVYHARMEAIGAAEAIVELLDTPPVEWPGRRRDPLRPEPPRIQVEGLTFAYTDGRNALTDLDLEIAPGETVALVGPSGSGKSTLALILLGLLRPRQGGVRINGVPLDALDVEAWRDSVAWVPQQPRLFYGTVRDNICLGRPDASPESIRRAVRDAQADAVIEGLPQGLDTPIGERGARLSGGEAQRIAIARALLKDAPFVVVDEVSAHLDADNERRLMDALRVLGRGRSMLVIAHRLATVRTADRIIVMEEGRIREQGRHEQLMAAGGLYSLLTASAEGGGA